MIQLLAGLLLGIVLGFLLADLGGRLYDRRRRLEFDHWLQENPSGGVNRS